jgi:hypothetical protein
VLAIDITLGLAVGVGCFRTMDAAHLPVLPQFAAGLQR